ncbi:tyrosine-type recombinase/integrase [Gordonia alkaliphila]|uniref:Site-specific integrase n=1 Tax=Gordonia alkaliphila TaxID=1053547 RepID=A0ABP8ZG46_9ACTN
MTRLVQATGETEAKAKSELKTALRDRSRPAGGEVITSDSTVAELLDYWLDEVDRSDRSSSTKSYYRRAVEKAIKPGLAEVRLHEATTGRIEVFLKSLAAPSAVRDSRTVLRQAFALAARHDAVQHNPVSDTSKPPASMRRAKALTVAEVKLLRQRVKAWQDEQKSGPKRAYDLAEILDVMIGTGSRIGEVLALRWVDVDVTEAGTRVTIAGTVVEVGGRGVERQDHTKTQAGHRTVLVPTFTAEAIERQREREVPSALGLLFPTRTGRPRSPSNVRTAWRKVRGDEFSWVKPHDFRKTVGTMVERELGLSAASAQLGHSGTAVTERHYIERASLGPDVRATLDKLAP